MEPMSQETLPRSAPELIVVTKPDAELHATDQGVASATSAPVSDIQRILDAEGLRMEPLVEGATPAVAAPSPDSPDSLLASMFYVPATEDRVDDLCQRLNECEAVETAYVKPVAEPPSVILEEERADRGVVLNDMYPTTTAAPPATPSFVTRQDYLDAAPVGIDASYAWGRTGGRGANVSVIDCEWGWNFTHEDLQANSFGLIAGSNHSSTNHGTAVMGVVGADVNSFGCTGIAPDARIGASSFVGQSSSQAIRKAADSLAAGDIILLEIHRRGPNGGGGGQQGFIAIEWWPDDYLAIRYAVSKGIIVVEAAGNGWEDLDAAVYDNPGNGFPSWWKNPFRLQNPSSGAVVVGAGSPPSGTHGRTTSPWNLPYVDRARCGFSNWGARVDAQGWGWEVTTGGYGDLQGGSKNRWYTDTFSGTSSASPVVVGALACTQGVLNARNMPLMSSHRARTLLRSTGSPQQAAPGRPVSQRIGKRPNLRQLIPAALKQWVSATIRYTYALHTSQAVWGYLDGFGWRRIRTGSPDGCSNMFGMCCEAQATGKKMYVYIDDIYLYNIMAMK